MEFTLNGRQVSVPDRDGASLLEVLREYPPEGSRGACTVVVDGGPVVSCARPAARVAGTTATPTATTRADGSER